MGERILFRKLQLTGGSTVTVSLPKEWIKTYNMNKGDLVNIEELASGDLRLSPLQKDSTKREIVIDCCAIKDGLIDLVIGGYIAGADVIRLTCSSPISRKIKSDIRGFLRDTRGMEIEVDNEKEIRIISILNPSELRLQVSINRMYILISSLVNDAFDVLMGESVELLYDIDDRERQIDARRLLLERQVAASLQQPSVERKLGIDRFSAMEHASIARVLERMGDHATRLAHLVNENSDVIKIKTSEMPLSAIPIWSNNLKTIVHNMNTHDIELIHSAKIALTQLGNDLEDAEADVWTGSASAERLLSEFRISESVRRLCAYSVNLAEILINMLMYKKLEKI
jgi:phosphate uptake regulator